MLGTSDTVISGGDEETLRTLRKIHMQTHFTSTERKILTHFEVLGNIGHRMNLAQAVVVSSMLHTFRSRLCMSVFVRLVWYYYHHRMYK